MENVVGAAKMQLAGFFAAVVMFFVEGDAWKVAGVMVMLLGLMYATGMRVTGIVAREVRRDWVTLEIPPLEHWEQPLRWLSPAQRERIEQASFFEFLQREIPQRLLEFESG